MGFDDEKINQILEAESIDKWLLYCKGKGYWTECYNFIINGQVCNIFDFVQNLNGITSLWYKSPDSNCNFVYNISMEELNELIDDVVPRESSEFERFDFYRDTFCNGRKKITFDKWRRTIVQELKKRGFSENEIERSKQWKFDTHYFPYEGKMYHSRYYSYLIRNTTQEAQLLLRRVSFSGYAKLYLSCYEKAEAFEILTHEKMWLNDIWCYDISKTFKVRRGNSQNYGYDVLPVSWLPTALYLLVLFPALPILRDFDNKYSLGTKLETILIELPGTLLYGLYLLSRFKKR